MSAADSTPRSEASDRTDEQTEFERFTEMAKRLISVPKHEIDSLRRRKSA